MMLARHAERLRAARPALATAMAVAAAVLAAPGIGYGITYKLVRDPANRFTIDIPSTWGVKPSDHGQALVVKGPAPAGQLPDSLDVIVETMPTSISPQNCVYEAEQVMRFAIHTWTNVSQGPIAIGGKPGYNRIYTWTAKPGGPRRSIQACVTTGHTAYMMVATTANTPADVSADMPVLLHMIETFRINPEAPSQTPTQQGPQER
jgi:hypothetical protein